MQRRRARAEPQAAAAAAPRPSLFPVGRSSPLLAVAVAQTTRRVVLLGRPVAPVRRALVAAAQTAAAAARSSQAARAGSLLSQTMPMECRRLAAPHMQAARAD